MNCTGHFVCILISEKVGMHATFSDVAVRRLNDAMMLLPHPIQATIPQHLETYGSALMLLILLSMAITLLFTILRFLELCSQTPSLDLLAVSSAALLHVLLEPELVTLQDALSYEFLRFSICMLATMSCVVLVHDIALVCRAPRGQKHL